MDVYGDTQTEWEEVELKSFTLKQLIRKLHMTEPVYNVMSLLGKKLVFVFIILLVFIW